MCINPMSAWYRGTTAEGKKKLVFSSSFNRPPDLLLPCGKCLGCQVDNRNRWISRMLLEHYVHDNVGTFITLTYRDPAPPSLVKKDVQKFLKRFRNLSRDFGISLPKFRYFFCGEYGSKFGRPHYHGLLFGVDCFAPCFDSVIVDFKDGYPVYSSRVISQVWSKGFITVDRITAANIRYVSKYLMKSSKKRGDEFTLRSIGLGADFFFSFGDKRSDVRRGEYFDSYTSGVLHFPLNRGKMQSLAIPYKAFDRYLEKLDPFLLAEQKIERFVYTLRHPSCPSDIRRRAEWLKVVTATKPNERKLDNET